MAQCKDCGRHYELLVGGRERGLLCGHYSEEWDAFFCHKCNLWLEKCCPPPPAGVPEEQQCEFKCWNRPERPLDIDIEDWETFRFTTLVTGSELEYRLQDHKAHVITFLPRLLDYCDKTRDHTCQGDTQWIGCVKEPEDFAGPLLSQLESYHNKKYLCFPRRTETYDIRVIA